MPKCKDYITTDCAVHMQKVQGQLSCPKNTKNDEEKKMGHLHITSIHPHDHCRSQLKD
jgi:hypothetical protein